MTRIAHKRAAVVIALFVALSIATTAPAGAEKALQGEVTYYLNLGWFTGEGGCPEVPWVGNVEFDGVAYGAVFEGIEETYTGSAYHYRQSWTLYSQPIAFSGGVLEECPTGDIVMAGETVGTNVLAPAAPSFRYAENGVVEYAAGDFAEWAGHRVHGHGAVYFDDLGLPWADGVFNVN